ncbi:DUF433 domain-containing protein [Synechococcales cyanobacterium C]|uniref:DUF433 domain-containing protein n=1 Tax=Petrachloros mirabilis ULC683 TaxID=2781853 RepID=A0A8K2A9Q2_9CYAN|nr:DUF433 domain-containing protein [Petrachloros mirabilis]NCJ08270.1 DUF433 domain-containing protein [Petrachloros mirabilis ULC683]
MPTVTQIGTLIANTSAINGSRPMIAGTKTSVRRVAGLYQQGASAEEIVRRLKHLSLAQVYAALAHYHANREQIEADLAEEEAEYFRLAALQGDDMTQASE